MILPNLTDAEFSDGHYTWSEDGKKHQLWIGEGAYPDVEAVYSDKSTFIYLTYHNGIETKIVAYSDGTTETWTTGQNGQTSKQEDECFLF